MTSQLSQHIYTLILNLRKTWSFIVRVNFIQFIPVRGVLYSKGEECCGGGCSCGKEDGC